ncbi:MAG: hypothetical protein JWO36_4074 [Myxococcales bacterium]|nr:hypothetical protein [Myxococcales bacterium]
MIESTDSYDVPLFVIAAVITVGIALWIEADGHDQVIVKSMSRLSEPAGARWTTG